MSFSTALAARTDHWLATFSGWWARSNSRIQCTAMPGTSASYVNTCADRVRVVDCVGRSFGSGSGSIDAPVVVFAPDGPNVAEHYQSLMAQLSPYCRVVCFDMAGFGLSVPSATYTHALDPGAQVILDVLNHLNIRRAILAFSCANGFYALRAAALAPQRITRLVLTQTPSLAAMHAWTRRVVPKPLAVPVLGQPLGWLFKRQTAATWYRLALAGIKTPCTVIWGGRDRSHRQTPAHALREIVPHAEFIAFEDCGHFPDLEQSQRYADILKTILRSTEPLVPEPLRSNR